MTFEEARKIRPGDTILYNDGWTPKQAKVTGAVHTFKRDRGQVVYVPVKGELVVHTKITRVERNG